MSVSQAVEHDVLGRARSPGKVGQVRNGSE